MDSTQILALFGSVESRLKTLEIGNGYTKAPQFSDSDVAEILARLDKLEAAVTALTSNLGDRVSKLEAAAAKTLPPAALVRSLAEPIGAEISATERRLNHRLEDLSASTGSVALAAKNSAKASAEVAKLAVLGWASAFANG